MELRTNIGTFEGNSNHPVINHCELNYLGREGNFFVFEPQQPDDWKKVAARDLINPPVKAWIYGVDVFTKNDIPLWQVKSYFRNGQHDLRPISRYQIGVFGVQDQASRLARIPHESGSSTSLPVPETVEGLRVRIYDLHISDPEQSVLQETPLEQSRFTNPQEGVAIMEKAIAQTKEDLRAIDRFCTEPFYGWPGYGWPGNEHPNKIADYYSQENQAAA